jgi:hypothetical protein
MTMAIAAEKVPNMTQISSPLVKCPICHKQGRLGKYRPTGSSIDEFVVRHEQIDDHYWGTDPRHKVQAIRRCYIKKAPHRAWAKETLGF